MKAVFLLDEDNYKIIYSEDTIDKISKEVEVIGRFDKKDIENIDLSDVNIIFSGWGGFKIDDELLAKMPKLEVVFYGAGSIKKVQSDAMWQKNIKITSASMANAKPVAQYTTSLIQLSLKNFFSLTRKVKKERNNKLDVHNLTKGFHKRNIGIISYSKIGKLVVENLQYLADNNIYVYDPFYSYKYLEKKGLIKESLENIFKKCDIISLHTPLLKETENMIDSDLLKLMKENSVFINTSRGKIVNSKDLEDVLLARQDILAILDVTDPEPLDKDSKLYDMKNVIISPHIAGSLGNETYVMGEIMYEELLRFLKGDKLKYQIEKKEFERMA